MHKAVDKWAQAPACNAVKMGGEKMASCSRMRLSGLDRSDLDRIGKVGRAVSGAASRSALRHAMAPCRASRSCKSCRARALHAMQAIHSDRAQRIGAGDQCFLSLLRHFAHIAYRTPITHHTRRATNKPATASSHARANTLR
ncbi:hypothetical protein XarbCFBP8152_15970 [Xanthomonas arboricola]|nr:hypothetical protein XarbCFBP8152_15970 [Xanthomonas arboricola]